MTEPVPQVTDSTGSQDQISREQLRAVLAALGFDLPVTMADVQEQATNFIKLQDQISQAYSEILQGAASGHMEPVDADRMKALADMQDKLQQASTLLQKYSYEQFTDAGKLTDLGVGQIQQLYKDKILNEDQVLGRLGALGYRPADAALLLQSYQKNLGGEDTQPLSVSQIQALTKAGIMSRDTARQKLVGLKYSTSDANALLKLIDDTGNAAGAGTSGSPSQGVNTKDPYGVNRAATGNLYGNTSTPSLSKNQPAIPKGVSPVGQLNNTFSNFQDMMQPSLPKVERLPTAQEFLSDFNNAFDTRINQLGLSPDVAAFARSFVKSKMMSQYTGVLGSMAQGGASPFQLTLVTPSERGAGAVSADPGIQAKIQRDGSIQSAAQAAGFTNEYVAMPKVMPLDFLNQELDAGTITMLYEGSRSGAGQGQDRGATQAVIREGV